MEQQSIKHANQSFKQNNKNKLGLLQNRLTRRKPVIGQLNNQEQSVAPFRKPEIGSVNNQVQIVVSRRKPEIGSSNNQVQSVVPPKRPEIGSLDNSNLEESNKNVVDECIQLYDPCTKEPIQDINALEKRVRELKKQKNTTPVGLYGLTTDTTNYEFLVNVFMNPAISLDDMVSFKLGEGRQVGSDIYEVLSRLFVFFGGMNGVNPRQGGNYKFMKKIEDAAEIYDDSLDALKRMKCSASRAMGMSDITLINVRKDTKGSKPDGPYCEVDCEVKEKGVVTTYVMSVKWYKEEKNAEHYDLEKLFAAANKIMNSPQLNPVDIIVFLKSKREFHLAHNRASRQYVRELASTYFGWEEDVKPFLEGIRSKLFESAQIIQKTPREAFDLEYGRADSKPTLSLQLHQDIIVKGVCDQLEEQTDPLYLIGVLPRGGKTFIAGGIIREYARRSKSTNINVFWLTAAPNETMSQVYHELVDKFQDFNDFEFIEVKSNADFNKERPNTVFFCSTQLLIAAQKPGSKKREYLQQLLTADGQLGLIFFDEAHKTGTGDTTKGEIDKIIETYRQNNLPFIFLTATYYNILIEYQIQKSNTYIWDYTDVLATRSLATTTEQASAIQNLRDRFDEPGRKLVDTIIERRQLNGETLETMAKAYIGFPDLYFISADFQEEAKQRFETQTWYRPDQGINVDSIFAIKLTSTIADVKTEQNKIRKDAYRIFENLTNPKNMISLITPRDTFDQPDVLEVEGGEPLVKNQGLEPSILGRIHEMSRNAQSRFRLDQQPTLLMFMPTGGTGTNIFYLLCAWASLLLTHKWWRDNYEIACVVEEENVKNGQVGPAEASEGIHVIDKNPKSSILSLERDLHCRERPKGLLILAGEKLSMGVSLPCTDVVFLLNNKKSPDDIIQKMYRALTPSPGKQAAFIVDLNPVRTLAALYGYTRASHKSINTSSEILDIIYDTYSWDADVFEYHIRKGPDARPLSFQDKLREMYEKAERDPDYRVHDDIGGLEKKIAENIRKGLDPEMIKKLTGQIGAQKMTDVARRLGLQNGSNITLKSGKLVIRKPKQHVELDDGTDEKRDDSTDTVEIVIDNFIEIVIDFIKYIAITSTADTLEQALEEYERNQINDQGTTLQHNVLHMIRSRTNIQHEANDDLLSSLLVATVKSTQESSERIFRQMKGKVDERSIRKDKILAIIHKRLTPRQKQKKDHGEVFTPIEMIEGMLSHLPATDWSNPDLTWLDPANGIGNFPVVVFYKLDEGLKKWEPNEKKRRKHIIENMIFMMELQSNNNRIARNIFTSLCDNCTPNIWTVDTLKESNEAIHAHFKVKQFDRIIGNPPFQAFQKADGKRGGGDELYMKFVKKSLELLTPNGYLVFVHPPSWRKPEYTEGQKKSKNAGMFALMTHEHQMVYLEIHNSKDGMLYFKAGTRYDFYVIKNTKATTETIINDETRTEVKADLRDFEFLPNFNIKNVIKLFPKRQEQSCELGVFDEHTGKYTNSPCLLYEASMYETRKPYVSDTKTSTFQYPLVHSTPQTGPRYYYSNRKDRGLFGIPKVIFGDSGINEPIIDLDGEYGMTQHAIGLTVGSKSDATRLSEFLKSNFFKNILVSCSYSGFQIDWRLFTYFKDHFWETDVSLNEALISKQDDEQESQGGKRFAKTRKRKN